MHQSFVINWNQPSPTTELLKYIYIYIYLYNYMLEVVRFTTFVLSMLMLVWLNFLSLGGKNP